MLDRVYRAMLSGAISTFPKARHLFVAPESELRAVADLRIANAAPPWLPTGSTPLLAAARPGWHRIWRRTERKTADPSALDTS
jgi:hypothetical protein